MNIDYIARDLQDLLIEASQYYSVIPSEARRAKSRNLHSGSDSVTFVFPEQIIARIYKVLNI